MRNENTTYFVPKIKKILQSIKYTCRNVFSALVGFKVGAPFEGALPYYPN